MPHLDPLILSQIRQLLAQELQVSDPGGELARRLAAMGYRPQAARPPVGQVTSRACN